MSRKDTGPGRQGTRRTSIPYCKVLWSNHTEQEATWEKESDLKEMYPHLFEDQVNL
jgi:hypothetical protein